MTKEELDILEGILNEEILSLLKSGYGLKNDNVITMRGMLKKLNLDELYNFDKYDVED